MVLDVLEISESEMVSKGKWEKPKIDKFIKDLSVKHKSKCICLSLLGFYKEYYLGSNVIKHMSFYCRKHCIDSMKRQKISGFVSTSKDKLMMSFK